MAVAIPPLPDMGDRAVQLPANVLDPEYYMFLKGLLNVIADRDATIAAQAGTIAAQTAHIETLRVALNETRANPTTVYPVIPAF